MENKVQADKGVGKKGNAPPAVITVDTAGKDSSSDATPTKAYDNASQARTPKHANKSKDDEDLKDSSKSYDGNQQHSLPSHPGNTRKTGHSGWFPNNGPPAHYAPQQGSYPSHPYDNRMGPSQQGGFQPRDRHGYPPHQPPPPPAMQVSPGSGRYYYNNGPRSFSSAPPPPPPTQPPAYNERYPGHNDYPPQPPSHGYSQQPPQRGYGPPPVYPPQQPQQHQYGMPGYESGVPAPGVGWGPPPPSFPHGRPPHAPPPGGHRINHEPYSHGPPPPSNHSHHVNSNTFSRAVSSSFDRSIRSGDLKHGHGTDPSLPQEHHHLHHENDRDTGSLGDEASWSALKQVHSVDEEAMRKNIHKRKHPNDGKEPESNSSSLTNSPTDALVGKKASDLQREKEIRNSSLDSLSSVASAQEPIETQKRSSPGSGSATSLDLMKCPSGSSGLLMSAHQRSLSQFSLSEIESSHNKDSHGNEDREDSETGNQGGDESRKDISIDLPPTKKIRSDGKEKKRSPLSITCSPPTSPSHPKRKSALKVHQPQATYPHSKLEASPAYYDKQISSTYSLDSLPHMPRDLGHVPDSYTNPPPRPGSSSSSTITPMNVDHSEMRHPPGVSQIPSWEIHGQDSFGAGSTGPGSGLLGSFSFQQDYPMLSNSASGDMQGHVHHPPPPHVNPHQQMESRNQSFDGGHYPGGFGRTDSMMSYESRQGVAPPYEGRPGYQGQFPPVAPSWGSGGSYQHGYPHHRPPYPPMMRNYSEDSGRVSPPPGPGGMRMMPPSFPPPPEFRAPPSMVSKSVPQNTIMTSPYQPRPKVGPFGWTKDEDARLTDIMKKYKNPRDWEPIAKEHNRGRSAKECHERWIRYLKPGVRKGQWTDHEDAIVMEAVSTSSEQPFTRWSDLAQRLPGRVGKQIRDRWVNHLNPSINHLPFSREDDLLLWEGHKGLGKRWVEISTKYFNNNRSENHIKNRWYSASFKKFITNQFGPDAYSGGKATKKDSPTKKKVGSPKRQKDLEMQSV